MIAVEDIETEYVSLSVFKPWVAEVKTKMA